MLFLQRPFACLFITVLAMRGSVPAASLTPLGHLGTELPVSEAKAVTPDGSVVVGYSRSTNGFEAFRWTAGSGMVGLGDLPGGDFISEAAGVSADGSVVVGTANSTNTPAGWEAFYWTTMGGMRRLATSLPAPLGGTRANGVSADGAVVVGSGTQVPGHDEYGSVAFRWTAADGIRLIGDLPGGIENSGAQAVTPDGNVVVGSGTLEEGNEAYRWTASTGMVGLGQLPGALFPVSAAQAVSADGSVVVGFAFSSNGPQEAFRSTAAGGMVALGNFPSSQFRSVALGVSGDGTLVVGEGQSEFSQEASLWRAETGMVRLWDHLLTLGVDPSADGWTFLFSAAAVSTDGRFVVGWGRRNGLGEAYLADLAPTLRYVREPGGLRLTWPSGYRLQKSPGLSAPSWEEVTNANSPYLLPVNSEATFLRIVSGP